jgi:serine/threonine-protein kinase RsbW
MTVATAREQLMAGQAGPPWQPPAQQAAPPLRRWSRVFPADVWQVRRARHWIQELFPPCDPLDALLEIVSELATNALRHTRSGLPGGWFGLDVLWSPDVVRVVVSDQGSAKTPAVIASAAEDAYLEGGRGLWLVQSLSLAWGTGGDARARWVWADVEWLPACGPLLAARGDDPAVMAAAAGLRRRYPGAAVWFGEETQTWWAALPGASGASDLINAGSATALDRKLAACYPAGRAGLAARSGRYAAAPVPQDGWPDMSRPAFRPRRPADGGA